MRRQGEEVEQIAGSCRVSALACGPCLFSYCSRSYFPSLSNVLRLLTLVTLLYLLSPLHVRLRGASDKGTDGASCER
jgi:hypothetical protein